LFKATSLGKRDGSMTIADYIAIGVLIALALWAGVMLYRRL
jgi:hypothetical protein